jgi:hypothetical protein
MSDGTERQKRANFERLGRATPWFFVSFVRAFLSLFLSLFSSVPQVGFSFRKPFLFRFGAADRLADDRPLPGFE